MSNVTGLSESASHVVMFSGGLGSWLTARRVADEHGQVFLGKDVSAETPASWSDRDERCTGSISQPRQQQTTHAGH